MLRNANKSNRTETGNLCYLNHLRHPRPFIAQRSVGTPTRSGGKTPALSSSAFSRTLCILLSLQLGISTLPAQAPSAEASPAPAAVPGSSLTITVLEGSNAVNSLTQVRAIAPVVEIRDQNEFPVEGATVTFTLPGQGPGGVFPGGSNSFTTRSDARGQAGAPPFNPRAAGRFDIQVSATQGSRKGETVIHQVNSTGAYVGPEVPKRPWYKSWKPWVIIGAVAVGGAIAIAETTGGGSSSGTTPVSVTPGPPVFH